MPLRGKTLHLAEANSNVRRFLPDRMLRHQDMPRTVSLVVLAVLTLAACFLNAFAQIEWFATAAGVTGFAFGGMQGIVPALASEIFGLKYLATNYSMLQLGPAICKCPITHPCAIVQNSSWLPFHLQQPACASKSSVTDVTVLWHLCQALLGDMHFLLHALSVTSHCSIGINVQVATHRPPSLPAHCMRRPGSGRAPLPRARGRAASRWSSS